MPIRKLTTSQPPDWSRRLNGYFIAFTRKTFRWSPAYRDCVKNAEVRLDTGIKYRCKACGNLVERSEKQVDHIRPVVEVGHKWNGSWDYYRDRLFVSVTELQVLCKGCHRSKTTKENEGRRQCKTKQKRKSASRPE